MTPAGRVHLLDVFPAAAGGGNPAPIALDADDLDDAAMQAIAREYGCESAFVVAPPDGCDVALRFWVPNHEMSMCGHATVGAVWLLSRLGRLGDAPLDVTIWTASGRVTARVPGDDGSGLVEVSQPDGRFEPLSGTHAELVRDVLGLDDTALGSGPFGNAVTSRVKTLVPVADEDRLHALAPRFAELEAVCERIGSTGLYPYAPAAGEPRAFHARQFPRASGYPEDPATGIAATALACALRFVGVVDGSDEPVVVRQGWAMGRPSEMTVRFALDSGEVAGCWLGGRVTPAAG